MNVGTTEQFYEIEFSLFSGIDFTQVANISFVVISGNVTDPTSTLSIRLGDHPFIPGIGPNPALTAGDISMLPGVLGIGDFASEAPNPVGNVVLNQSSNTEFDLIYNVSTTGSYVGSITSFDDFQTTATVETEDLSGLTDIVLGLQLASGVGTISLEIEDATGPPGNKSNVLLTGVNTTEQFYQVPMTAFTGVDLTQVKNINVVILSSNVSDDVTTLSVRLGDHPYDPVSLISGTDYDESLLTNLWGYFPSLISGTGNTNPAEPDPFFEIEQTSGDEFNYQYDLSSSTTGFTFANITPGYFDGGGVFHGVPMDLSAGYVFAVQGGDGMRVKINVVDVNQITATFILELDPIMQNFTLDLSAGNVPTGFDNTQIAEIVMVQDRTIGSFYLEDIVNVHAKGIFYIPTVLPAELADMRDNLIDEGLDYFGVGTGVDTTTHFPYDSIDSLGVTETFTQPTLIGFYAQILGDVVNGALDNGMTIAEALTELEAVLDNLLAVQAAYGWNGLLPWLNLSPLGAYNNKVGLGDNANLAQSLAVAVGALELAGLSGADLTKAQAITTKVDTFLDNQETGYLAFVDPAFDIFYGEVNSSTGVFGSYHNDRVANEFRGAIAFLNVRYPSLPDTTWTNLQIVTADYEDRNSDTISNLSAWDGGAFQMFWPSLRNDESQFVGFANALYNQLLTQLDYSNQNRIPGIVSASQNTDGTYYGNSGIPQIAENLNGLLVDTGSTYALAAAMSIDAYAVLGWLDAIDNLSDLSDSLYGFYDSARSNSEIANINLGIDVASTVLGLAEGGPDAFEEYLRNRNMELDYNTLYDDMSRQLGVDRTDATIADAPEFPDRSLAVFTNFSSETGVNITINPTTSTGVLISNTNPPGTIGEHIWTLDSAYDAQANQLVIYYTGSTLTQPIQIVLLDASDTVLSTQTLTLTTGSDDYFVMIDFENLASLQNVAKISFGIDAGEVTVRSLDFQHVPSSQRILPDGSLGSGDVTDLPGNGVAQGLGSGTISNPSADLYTFNFDLTAPGSFGGISINFDPTSTGASADLSGLTSIIFGIDSDKANNLKFEIEDADGNSTLYFLNDVDVSKNYYEFLTSLAAGDVDLTRVTRINFLADGNSILPGDEIGQFSLELKGLTYP